MSFADEPVNPPVNLNPAEHIAIGNRYLAKAGWFGYEPARQLHFAAMAQANFAAATAKATAEAIYGPEYEAEILAKATNMAERIREARDRAFGEQKHRG